MILTRVLVCNLMLLAQHYQNCNPKNLANVSAVLLVSLFLMRRRSDQFLHASENTGGQNDVYMTTC